MVRTICDRTCLNHSKTGQVRYSNAYCIKIFVTDIFRVSDYVHHPIDVLAGLVIGAAVGLVLGYQTIQWIRKNEADNCDQQSEEGRQHLASMRSGEQLMNTLFYYSLFTFGIKK